LDSAVSTALFRVAQEALTNIIKYAQARTAWIRLQFAAQEVKLEVEDDGVGFDPSLQVSNRSTWGLLGMQERAELLGGQFELITRPGAGTRVRVIIPYHPLTNQIPENSSTLASNSQENP
jgi:signal transduction histidine kinase